MPWVEQPNRSMGSLADPVGDDVAVSLAGGMYKGGGEFPPLLNHSGLLALVFARLDHRSLAEPWPLRRTGRVAILSRKIVQVAGWTMRSALCGLVFVLLALLCMNEAAQAKQLAIVVGNNAYIEVPALSTAVNDARAMSVGLAKAGFAVETVENGTKRQMSRAFAAIEGKIEPGDTILFHFSGHGFEIDGQNWLLPVDVPAARPGEEGLVKDESFSASEILDRFRARGAGTVVAILDACRDNPFAQPGTRGLGGTRGLARMDAAGGVFILFSAGSKQTALDRLSDADPNPTSIFVRSFLPLLERPDLSLIDMAKETQEHVKALAQSVGHEQVPAYYDGIVGRVTLTGALVALKVAPLVQPPAPAQRSSNAEDVFWQSVQNSQDAAMLKAYLAQVSAGTFGGTYKTLAELKLAALTPPTVLVPAGRVLPEKPPEATGPEISACDLAAASPEDGERPQSAPGVADSAITASSAIAACVKASAVPQAPRRVFYQLARAYAAAADEIEAVRALTRAADLRHPLALLLLGQRYRTGRGVTRDYAEARLLLERAIDANIYKALVEIAGMYAEGQGTPRDLKVAVSFYQLALKHGEQSALPMLGLLYAEGRGVQRDVRRACELFEKGATQGLVAAGTYASKYCR